MDPLTVHKDQIDPLLVAQRFRSAPSEHNTVKKKEGYLYKKSDHLKQWRKRYFICENNFLKISHDTSGKKLRIIDLNNYSPSYQGKMNDKYVFVFIIRQGLKLEPLSLVLGSTDEGLARDWFKFLLSVMVRKNFLFFPSNRNRT